MPTRVQVSYSDGIVHLKFTRFMFFLVIASVDTIIQKSWNVMELYTYNQIFVKYVGPLLNSSLNSMGVVENGTGNFTSSRKKRTKRTIKQKAIPNTRPNTSPVNMQTVVLLGICFSAYLKSSE